MRADAWLAPALGCELGGLEFGANWSLAGGTTACSNTALLRAIQELVLDDIAPLSLPACPRTDYISDHFEGLVTQQWHKFQILKFMFFRAQCWPSAASWFALAHFLHAHTVLQGELCQAVFLAYHRALEWLPALAVDPSPATQLLASVQLQAGETL